MNNLTTNYIEFSPKNLKHFNLVSKALVLQKILKLPFVLFFFHDFFDPLERIKFNKILAKKNLCAVVFSSKVVNVALKDSKHKNIQKLLNNNVIAIYDKNENVLERAVLKSILKQENLSLVCAIWNTKIYRNFEIQKLVENKSLNKSLIVSTINQQKLKLLIVLSMLKKTN